MYFCIAFCITKNLFCHRNCHAELLQLERQCYGHWSFYYLAFFFKVIAILLLCFFIFQGYRIYFVPVLRILCSSLKYVIKSWLNNCWDVYFFLLFRRFFPWPQISNLWSGYWANAMDRYSAGMVLFCHMLP